MLTANASGIMYDSGTQGVELRCVPDGRWTVASGVSLRATGKSPWTPYTRDFYATEAAAVRAFLADLPDDAALRAQVIAAVERMHKD